jgi:hypothetical protein
LALEEGPCGREEICFYVPLQTKHRKREENHNQLCRR